MSIDTFFSDDGVDVEGLRAHLDGLEDAARAAAIRAFKPRHQKTLWPAVAGVLPLDLDFYVPPGTPPMTPVIHEGYNNQLPGFRVFQKVMVRPDGDDGAGELWGYNEFFLKGPIGPGYFVAVDTDEEDPGVVIDYHRVPPRKPEGWPRILPNSARLSRFVYNGTRDYMRGVSDHVSIGRAEVRGRLSHNYFMLCRREGATD